MLEERIRRCGEGGMSILVGTADAAGVPSCCRGIALTTSRDLSTVTVYVPVATSQEVIANLATTRRIAIAASQPIGHSTVQLKGTTAGVRLARAEEAEYVNLRLDQFADVLDQIGVPRRVTRAMNHWPAFAVDVKIEEVYDQTPGPNAGISLT